MKKTISKIGWPKLTNRRTSHRLVLSDKILNDFASQYIKRLRNLISHNMNNYQLQRNYYCLVPFIHRESILSIYFPKTIRDLNELANDASKAIAGIGYF